MEAIDKLKAALEEMERAIAAEKDPERAASLRKAASDLRQIIDALEGRKN